MKSLICVTQALLFGLLASSASASLLYATSDLEDGLTGFASRQLILGYGSGSYFPGWWLGAFDDTGVTSSGSPIPADQARIWSPMVAFSLSGTGALGTLSVPLNTSGVLGLRMEVYERSGPNGDLASSYTLLDTSELAGSEITNGAGWLGFDFGADVTLEAETDYFARLSLTESTNKYIWQAAYWMTSGGTYEGVRQSYNGIGTFTEIPVSYGMPGGGYRVVGVPGLHLTSDSLLAVPEPSSLMALFSCSLASLILRRRRK